MPRPEQHARPANSARKAQLQLPNPRHVASNHARFADITQTNPSKRRPRLSHMHHLSMNPDRRLHNAANPDVFTGSDQPVHGDWNEAAKRKGGTVRIRVPAAARSVDVAPRPIARTIYKSSAGWMKVDIELKPEHPVAWKNLRPHWIPPGGANILFAQHVKRFKTQALADVRLVGEIVSCSKFIAQAHVSE